MTSFLATFRAFLFATTALAQAQTYTVSIKTPTLLALTYFYCNIYSTSRVLT